MSAPTYTRPKRLWVAAIMNILIGLLALGLLLFLLMSPRVAGELRPSGGAAILGAVSPSFLVVASVVALFGKPYGRYLMLLAALVFYGILIVQNVFLFGTAQSVLGQAGVTKVVANVVRALLELLVNLWALLSFKTRQYFRGAPVAP